MLSQRRPRRNKKWALAGACQPRPCVVGHRRRIDLEQTHPGSSHRQSHGELQISLADHRAYGEGPGLYTKDPELDRMVRRKFGGQALRFSQPVSVARCRKNASPARREPGSTEQVRLFPAKLTVAIPPVDRPLVAGKRHNLPE